MKQKHNYTQKKKKMKMKIYYIQKITKKKTKNKKFRKLELPVRF